MANAGDSRCVLCRGGVAVDLSHDHKPEDDPERQRIENAGGRVTADGRVNGGLNLSRAIGEWCQLFTVFSPVCFLILIETCCQNFSWQTV